MSDPAERVKLGGLTAEAVSGNFRKFPVAANRLN
jgi:hypothetical protein